MLYVRKHCCWRRYQNTWLLTLLKHLVTSIIKTPFYWHYQNTWLPTLSKHLVTDIIKTPGYQHYKKTLLPALSNHLVTSIIKTLGLWLGYRHSQNNLLPVLLKHLVTRIIERSGYLVNWQTWLDNIFLRWLIEILYHAYSLTLKTYNHPMFTQLLLSISFYIYTC